MGSWLRHGPPFWDTTRWPPMPGSPLRLLRRMSRTTRCTILYTRITTTTRTRILTHIRTRIRTTIRTWEPPEGCRWICMCRRDSPTTGKLNETRTTSHCTNISLPFAHSIGFSFAGVCMQILGALPMAEKCPPDIQWAEMRRC